MRLLILILLIICLCVLWAHWTLRAPRKGDCLRPEVHENFLTPAECTEIIQRAKELGLDRSAVTSTTDGSGTIEASRTSTQVFLPDDDPVARRLTDKVASFLRVPPNRMEQIQVLHYGPGQKYEPHYDACNDGCDAGSDLPRVATFFIYLNDVEEGGETAFPMLGVGVAPKTGRACHWYNIDTRTGVNLPCALHGGSPVIRGEKWACNIWIR